MKIGVLALQGDFEKHEAMLRRIGVDSQQVRKPSDLESVDALIIPGGESTTIGKLMERYGLDVAIRERVAQGMPLYGTCAGMRESFEADLPFEPFETPVRAVFIRAPIVTEAGREVSVLSRFEDKIVAVQQGNLLATAFHPELTDDERIHRYFLSFIK
jgi:5'-phosphate synthase pdxT subunit